MRSFRALVFVVAWTIAACGATAKPPGPTSCGGSHEWPPAWTAGIGPVDGFSLAWISPSRVGVVNGTSQAWTLNIGRWTDHACVGWVESGLSSGSDTDRITIEAGESLERDIVFEDQIVPHKLSADLRNHPCTGICTDLPDGFMWLEVLPTPTNVRGSP